MYFALKSIGWVGELTLVREINPCPTKIRLDNTENLMTPSWHSKKLTRPGPSTGNIVVLPNPLRMQGKRDAVVSLSGVRSAPFSTTSTPQSDAGGRAAYLRKPVAPVAPYLPGRGRWAIKKAHGLDQWPTLHLVGALVYHLPK